MAWRHILILSSRQSVPDQHILPPGPADHVPPIWGETAIASTLLEELARQRVNVLRIMLTRSKSFGSASGFASKLLLQTPIEGVEEEVTSAGSSKEQVLPVV